MNKTAKKVVATILTTVMTVGAATVVSADDLSITLSHQPYSHALPSYIGEEEGIFEENGLNTEILWFSSGNTQNEALGANEWDAGACRTAPASWRSASPCRRTGPSWARGRYRCFPPRSGAA